MTSPRVSVVVPVFNPGDYLARSLASVAAQTYRDFELVLVDDGSTDPRTLALLERARREPAVSFHRTPNRGPSAARNLGVEVARGDYILPLDADDYLAPAFLAKTAPVLDAEPGLGVVYTWVGLVGGHWGTWRTGGFSVPELLTRCTLHVTALFRHQLWVDVGGYDPRFIEGAEDWDFWLGAAARGWQGRCVPEILAYYRRTLAGREAGARGPGVSTRLMRMLVAKHRPLYDAHLEDVLASMYEQRAGLSVSLERFYRNPAIRLLLQLRALAQRSPAA